MGHWVETVGTAAGGTNTVQGVAEWGTVDVWGTVAAWGKLILVEGTLAEG